MENGNETKRKKKLKTWKSAHSLKIQSILKRIKLLSTDRSTDWLIELKWHIQHEKAISCLQKVYLIFKKLKLMSKLKILHVVNMQNENISTNSSSIWIYDLCRGHESHRTTIAEDNHSLSATLSRLHDWWRRYNDSVFQFWFSDTAESRIVTLTFEIFNNLNLRKYV